MDISLGGLLMIALGPILRAVRRQWLLHQARRWQVLADVAHSLAQQEASNALYFEKKAMIARSDAQGLLP